MARKGLKGQPAEVKQAVRYLASHGLPCNVVVKPQHTATVAELSHSLLIPIKNKPHMYRAFKNYGALE